MWDYPLLFFFFNDTCHDMMLLHLWTSKAPEGNMVTSKFLVPAFGRSYGNCLLYASVVAFSAAVLGVI